MTPSHQPRDTSPGWRAIAILTLGMGFAVVVSWYAFALPFGPLTDSFGLDPASLLRPGRLGIYALQFALVAAFGFVMARSWLSGLSTTALARSFALAWLLEGVVLTIIGEPLVANELDPIVAWHYWLVATAGPLQPAAAFIGGWLALRSRAATRVDG